MDVTITIDTDVDNAEEVRSMVDRLFGETPEQKPAAGKVPTAAEKKAAKAAEKAANEKTTATSTHTIDEVRAKLKEYAALEGKEKAIQILKDNGADSIGELDEAKFDDVVTACGD